MTQNELKEAVISAIVEVFEERRDIMASLIAEVIEDVGLANAIEEVTEPDRVDRSEIFDILSDKA